MGASGNDLFAMQRAFNMRRRVHVYAGSTFQPRSSSKQKNFQPMIMLRHDKPSLFFRENPRIPKAARPDNYYTHRLVSLYRVARLLSRKDQIVI